MRGGEGWGYMASPSSKTSVDATKWWDGFRLPTPEVGGRESGAGEGGGGGSEQGTEEGRRDRGLWGPGDGSSPSPGRTRAPSHLGAASRQLRVARRTGGHVQVTLFLSLTFCPREAPRSWRRPRLLHVRLPPALQSPLPTDLAWAEPTARSQPPQPAGAVTQNPSAGRDGDARPAPACAAPACAAPPADGGKRRTLLGTSLPDWKAWPREVRSGAWEEGVGLEWFLVWNFFYWSLSVLPVYPQRRWGSCSIKCLLSGVSYAVNGGS